MTEEIAEAGLSMIGVTGVILETGEVVHVATVVSEEHRNTRHRGEEMAASVEITGAEHEAEILSWRVIILPLGSSSRLIPKGNCLRL